MDGNGHTNGYHMAPEDDESSRGRGLSEPILKEDVRERQDMRMVLRAVRERWPIKEEKRSELVNRLLEITEKRAVLVPTKEGLEACDGPADVNAIAAARVLVSMDSLNQSDERPDTGTQVNVNVGVQMNQAVQAAVAAEPEYLDWLRERALAEGGNADAVGQNGHERPVSDAAAHQGNGSGGNGHAKGNGWHPPTNGHAAAPPREE